MFDYYKFNYCLFLVNPCFNNPCQNGATCQSSGTNSYTCSCTVQYTGVNCQNCKII